MVRKVLAVDESGGLSYCTAAPEDRGRGRCNHVNHQEEGQTTAEFVDMVEKMIAQDGENKFDETDAPEQVPQDVVESYADRIDAIAGRRVTMDNFEEVLNTLTPQQIQELNKVGFDAAPEFSLPITDGEYHEKDLENKLHFATLPEYGIAGKMTAIQQMFQGVGEVPSSDGVVDIKGNYQDGLTPSEYFEKEFSARSASIAKSVSVSKPGYIARKLFYALSDIVVHGDCGGPHTGSISCKVPGGVCSKCMAADGNHHEPGTLVGSILSTNLSEPGTQLSMREFHTGGKNMAAAAKRDVINNTFDGFKSSYIVQEAIDAPTTEEARSIIFNRLKEEYVQNGVPMDEFNITMIAKKLTSYKRDKKTGTRYVQDGEKCDIMSIGAIGNMGNPFKSSELKNSYTYLTKPSKTIVTTDAANEIIF